MGSILPLLVALFWAAGLFELLRFILLVAFHFPVGLSGDEGLYFAMGRALLNGLHFYTDLFETKPPMISWISSLSLLVTKNDTLYRLIQAIGLAAIPVALAMFTIRLNRSHKWQILWMIAGLAFLFGSAIASFAVYRGIGNQTEAFGIVPAILALLAFADRSPESPMGIWRTAAIALCLAVAILLKEPFGLSILGGLLFLVSTKQDLVDAVKTIALGALLWLGILFLTGTAYGYFAIYLPEMLHGRVAENMVYHDYSIDKIFTVSAPLWLRGLNIHTLFQDTWTSPMRVVPRSPFLALALCVLFLAHQASAGSEDRGWRWFIVGAIAVAFSVLIGNLAFALEQILAILQFRIPFGDSFFQGKCILLLFYAVTCVVLLALLVYRSPGTAKRVAATAAALYLASLAVATGGDFFPQHFLFAVPVYAACFASSVRRLHSRQSQRWLIATLGLVGCLLILNAFDIHRFNEGELDAAKATALAVNNESIPRARQLDALMTACRFPRYFIAQTSEALHGLTIHSPYQLPYGSVRAASQRGLYFSDKQPNAFLHAKLLEDFADTPIVVADDSEAFQFPELEEAFRQQFTMKAPSCAQPYLPISGMTLFFRR